MRLTMIAALQIGICNHFDAFHLHRFDISVHVNDGWLCIVKFFLLQKLNRFRELKAFLLFERFAVNEMKQTVKTVYYNFISGISNGISNSSRE